jgi:hypothetical protein
LNSEESNGKELLDAVTGQIVTDIGMLQRKALLV